MVILDKYVFIIIIIIMQKMIISPAWFSPELLDKHINSSYE